MKRFIVILAITSVILSACLGTGSASPLSSPTALPTQSFTPAPTSAPTETSTAIPSPTPIPNPLEISAMRAREYPGSDIVIETVLDPGVNYQRYYVSYLSEGLKIYALMTIPTGEKPANGWPVIIFNHGYIPPDVYVTTQRYVAYVDLIARSGYIVFRSDYRGHDRSEGAARGAYSNPDYTVDVLNAVASMRKYPDADPNRIGMWGHSMGGYITLRSMVITKDIKAGVIWAGVVASYPDLLTKWR
ncbi:MAG TPA: alpha/beta fold hydrolase, partial [Anaerolineales bacterium]|nr:alpha/beta fold hydrolase [Anaerolineales bacterium]